jgi:hypothetical protein
MAQCTGIKRDGTQCLRMGSDRCFQHKESQCSICLGTITPTTIRTLDCTHSYHARCLERWKRTSRTCPMCRTPFDQPIYTVGVSIQCIHDGTRALHTYTTPRIETLAQSFGLDMNLMPRSLAEVAFEIDPGESIEQILTSLGVTSFRLPNSDTVRTT